MHHAEPDVVIVGAGIAGGALGTVLARAGFEVVLLERESNYPDRVRGEFIPRGRSPDLRDPSRYCPRNLSFKRAK
jgi:flavin-dependent dehydrogenase